MRFAKFTLASSFILVAAFIVVPGNKAVNSNGVQANAPVGVALDGSPLPPPPRVANTVLFADGSPLPPPPRFEDGTLMADGSPLPPPHRDAASASELS